jgi:hypothetical protein
MELLGAQIVHLDPDFGALPLDDAPGPVEPASQVAEGEENLSDV